MKFMLSFLLMLSMVGMFLNIGKGWFRWGFFVICTIGLATAIILYQ